MRHLSFSLFASSQVAGDDCRTAELAIGFTNGADAEQNGNLASIAAEEKPFVQARGLPLVDECKQLARRIGGG